MKSVSEKKQSTKSRAKWIQTIHWRCIHCRKVQLQRRSKYEKFDPKVDQRTLDFLFKCSKCNSH